MKPAVPNFLKFRMWKGSWIMLVLFVTLAAVDLYSTLQMGDISSYLETNVAYQVTGSWMVVIGINLLILYLVLWAYDHYNVTHRFMLCAWFVWFSIVRVSIIIRNFAVGAKVAAGEITMEMAQAVQPAEKIQYSAMTTFLPLLVLAVGTMLVYYLFKLDHNILKNE